MGRTRSVIKIDRSFDALVANADLTNFGTYSREHSPEEIATLIRAMAHATSDVIGAAPGEVSEYLGDSALIAFPGTDVDAGREHS